MNASQVLRRCAERLSAAGVAFRSEPDTLRVAAACPEVGDLLVYFDNGEIKVDIERITHCHFTPYEAAATYPAHSIDQCIGEAADFVCAVLKNEWILWRYPNGAGGCYKPGSDGEDSIDAPLEGETVEQFLWSGRIAGA